MGMGQNFGTLETQMDDGWVIFCKPGCILNYFEYPSVSREGPTGSFGAQKDIYYPKGGINMVHIQVYLLAHQNWDYISDICRLSFFFLPWFQSQMFPTNPQVYAAPKEREVGETTMGS